MIGYGWRAVAAFTVFFMIAPVMAAGISVEDDTGRIVELDRPAQRIVSLAPNITETLFAAGAGDRVIAAVNYSDYPEAAQEIPRVGTYDQLNIEAIVAMDPDLIVGWQSGNPDRQIERLRELGFTLYISEIHRLDDIPRTLRNVGHLAGTDADAAEAIDDYTQRLQTLRDTYADRETIDVFYQIWDNPLATINGEQLISDVIRGCGGYNVFSDLQSLAPRIGVESVLERDPEFILASGMGEERPDWLDDWRQWSELRAVEKGNLYFIPPQLLQRQTARVLEGMEMLCEQLEEARSR